MGIRRLIDGLTTACFVVAWGVALWRDRRCGRDVGHADWRAGR